MSRTPLIHAGILRQRLPRLTPFVETIQRVRALKYVLRRFRSLAGIERLDEADGGGGLTDGEKEEELRLQGVGICGSEAQD